MPNTLCEISFETPDKHAFPNNLELMYPRHRRGLRAIFVLALWPWLLRESESDKLDIEIFGIHHSSVVHCQNETRDVISVQQLRQRLLTSFSTSLSSNTDIDQAHTDERTAIFLASDRDLNVQAITKGDKLAHA